MDITRYEIRLEGEPPGLLMHSTAGMIPSNPLVIERRELTRKTASKRTDAEEYRIAEIETLLSVYWNEDDRPTLPPQNIRGMIERAARTLRDGPRVRRGLQVAATVFTSPQAPEGATRTEIAAQTQHIAPVKVGRSQILRTRALFKEWECEVTVDALDEHVDRQALNTWLDIGGRMIGLGDWRPDTSGTYGRFTHRIL